MNEKPTRVLYLDLDGTVRKGFDELGRFVNKKEDVEIFSEALVQMRKYKLEGWRIVGITNQGGVATGQLDYKDMKAAIIETNEQAERLFDKIMVCVHHPEAKEQEMAVCWCRKPRIGNIVLAAYELGKTYLEYYPPHLSLFVGDRPEDKQCAENAGIPFMEAKDWRTGHVLSTNP